MALSIVATSSRDELKGGTTFTKSHSCSGSNRLLVVCVVITSSSEHTCTGVKYNGIPLSIAVQRQNTYPYTRSSIWYLVNPPSGTYNIEVTFDSDPLESASFAAISFAGADQTDPIGATGSNFVNSDSIFVNLTTQRNNSYLVDAEGAGTTSNHPDSSQTVVHEGGGGRRYVTYKATGTAGSYLMSYTGATRYRVLCVAEIKEWVPISRSHGYIFG